MIEQFTPGNLQSSWTVRRDRARTVLRLRPAILVPFLLFVLSISINMAHVATTEFHPDETRWINRAHYFTDLRDPFGPTWEDQYITRGQPPLGSYLMGLGLLLQGRDTTTNGVWDFAYGSEWNAIAGAMPEQADLEAARRINAVVGAVAVVVVYFIANALAGPVAGAAAGFLLAIHPLHIWIASQALSDQLLILLVSLTLLTAIRLGNRPGRGSALLLGVLLGLGGAAKLSPLLLSLPLAVYGVGLLVLAQIGLANGARARSLGPLLIAQPTIAFITFVVAYPYLWPDPIGRTWQVFQTRSQEMEEQSAAWPGVAIENPVDALTRIYDRLTWQFSATGNLAEDILGWFRPGTSVWGIDLVLAAVGVAVLAWLVMHRGLASGTALMTFLMAGQAGAIIVGMRVDFYRYHLPIALVVAILFGLGTKLIWQWLANRGGARIWNLVPGIAVEPPVAPARIEDRNTIDSSTGASVNRPAQTGSQ